MAINKTINIKQHWLPRGCRNIYIYMVLFIDITTFGPNNKNDLFYALTSFGSLEPYYL